MSDTSNHVVAGTAAQLWLSRPQAMDIDKPRVYLAGPMSGLPETNYPAFNAEARRLRQLGYHVENPADTPDQETWADYMRHALAKLVTCDMIALLPGYETSRGATIEHQIARDLGMPAQMADSMIDPASKSEFA
ncbi:MAG: DUF4406 domain-containing protein [Salinisphaera sp.]|jgi:hypothetical protein|nr:DUF4406 domain-containing protein [Salinisphaera sp.]